MILENWKKKWGVSDEAMADLCDRLTMASAPDLNISKPATDEGGLQNMIRMGYVETGGLLWRNNNGAAQDSYGNFFRYGLANDNKGMNEVIKSGDLIGIRPVIISPAMVGQTFGRFISYEVKSPNWKPTNSKREKAQMAWAALIISLGGDARIVNRMDQIW